MPPDVLVLGSANVDLVMRVDRHPGAGETVAAERVGEMPGGKGLNQAVAAARAGADTCFVGAVGDDHHAEVLRSVLSDEGIDISCLGRSTSPTGMAVVAVQPSGENTILILPGANADVRIDESARQRIAGAGVLVAQLETPVSVVAEALAHGRAAAVPTILNAAPAVPLDEALLDLVDVLVVNEHEASMLGGDADPLRAAAQLCRSVDRTVVTLGAAGAAEVARDGSLRRYPGVPADAVDTTGAGDTFVGVLAATIARGGAIDMAIRRGVCAGAIAVERMGAVPAIPTSAEVDRRLMGTDSPGSG